MNGKQMKSLLEKNGFVCWDIEGSHHHMIKIDDKRIKTTIPIHGKKELGIGLERAILKQAGIKK